jgi:hypothetical protein
LLNYLNQNSGALTVIFTGVVSLSTVVYAVLTAKLVKETRRMRQAQTEPKIQVVIKPRDEWINIVHIYIRNIGLGPAYDISFNVSAEAGGEGAQALIDDFTKANFFLIGLKYLGPGQEIVPGYSQITKDFDQKIKSILVFTVQYRDATNNKYQETFRIDFSEFKGLKQLGKPHLYAIAQLLEKIQSDFHNLATGFNRIKADIYNSADREVEQKELEEHFNKLKEESEKTKELDSGS